MRDLNYNNFCGETSELMNCNRNLEGKLPIKNKFFLKI